MTKNNVFKVLELIQQKPWQDDIVEQIEKLIKQEPNQAFKRMMGISMSAVILELEEQKRNKK